jgi:nucleoside 2-deoxyribosyltransferase
MSDERKRRSYFAAPLFNEMERRFNLEIVSDLEKNVEVFLPQRDGGLLVKLVNEGLTVQTAEQTIFEKDLAAIESSDLVIAVLDGGHIDEGVAFEIGYAFALGKTCVGFQTDARRVLPTGNNPMIGRSLSFICQTRQHLLDWVENFYLSKPLDSEIQTQHSSGAPLIRG